MRAVIFVSCMIMLNYSFSVAQTFYDIMTIQRIELAFMESNWDQLLDGYAQTNTGEMLVGTATINGTLFENVGVKYKGHSTYNPNNAKNPMNIQLDYVVNQNYNGFETIKLSNGKNDPSFVREVLGYEIGRKYMDMPLSNYTQVYVNGNYFGLFSSTEAINGDYSKTHFNCNSTRIKCNPVNGGGSSGGSSLTYVGTDSSLYYNSYEVKSDYGWQDLIDLTNIIKNQPQNIESILDIDRAIWMLAYNNVLVNLDSYLGPFRQNYYLIKDKNNRMLPVIWDMNENLGGFEMINSPTGGPPTPPNLADLIILEPFLREGVTGWPLLNLVYSNMRYRKMYLAHFKTILAENFENSWYHDKADSLQTLITTALQTDPNAFYSYSEFIGNLTGTHTSMGNPPQKTIGVTELMDGRVSFLQPHADLQGTEPVINSIEIPDTVYPFSQVNVKVTLTDATYAYIGYRFSKDDIFTKIELFDDGVHNDGSASDGVYGAAITVDEGNTHYYFYAENAETGIFSPVRAEHEYYNIHALTNISLDQKLVINEVMASNSSAHSDEAGEFDDWVELYNNSSAAISLSGYYLTDDEFELTKWAFPDTTIAAGSFLIVWADNDISQGSMHAAFKLSATGESVFLIDPDLTVTDTVSYTSIDSDTAYARVPNGTGSFVMQASTFQDNNENTKGIEELNTADPWMIFPNPAKESFTISCDEGFVRAAPISIYNSVMQLQNTYIIQQGDHQLTISCASWKSGIYYIVSGEFHKIVVVL